MPERAHPDDPAFRDKWRFHLRKGFLPWISVQRNPYRLEVIWRYQWVSRYCKGRDVLDIPCGVGWGTSLLKGCRTIIGVDIASEATAEAQQRYGKHAKFLVGDASRMPFRSSTFDVVACLEGIEHVPPIVGKALVAESARVLRPGGMLFLSSPHCRTKEHSGNPHHIKEYKPEEVSALIEPYCDIVDVTTREVDIMAVSYFQAKRRDESRRQERYR